MKNDSDSYDFEDYVCKTTGLPCCGCSLFCEHRKPKEEEASMGIGEEAERYLVIKMADLVMQWKRPYDDMDTDTRKANAPIELKYETYKEMFVSLYCK